MLDPPGYPAGDQIPAEATAALAMVLVYQHYAALKSGQLLLPFDQKSCTVVLLFGLHTQKAGQAFLLEKFSIKGEAGAYKSNGDLVDRLLAPALLRNGIPVIEELVFGTQGLSGKIVYK